MKRSAFGAYLLACLGASIAANPKLPTFFARRDYAGLYSTQAAVADTNRDGIPDLIADEGGYIEVLFGNGDGTFRAGTDTITVMDYDTGFALADLDGDGKIDLIQSGTTETGGGYPFGIGVSLGNGDGTFQRGVFYEMGINARTGNPVVGDFNGDGILDIAVAGPSGVWLFTGKGGGIFNPGVVVAPLPSMSGALAATDFNGDHNLDLVVTLPFGSTDGSGDGFVVILGNGNGTFRRPQAFAEPKNTEALAVGSLGKDGPPSIAVCDGAYNAVLLYYGNGAGGFSKPRIIPLPGATGVAIGDVNGDGIPDLVSSGGYVALGTPGGGFSKPSYYPIEGAMGTRGLVLADLRNNGLTDIVMEGQLAVSVLLNDGKGKYEGKFEDGEWIQLPGGAACGAAADYNGDGKPDLAVNTPTGVAVLLGTGNARSPFTKGATMTLADTGCVLSGDLNGDGIPDLIVTTPTAVVAYLGNGDGTFRQSSSTPAEPGYVVLADFNRDGKLDFATSANQLALGNGDGTFQTPVPIVAGAAAGAYSNIAAGDINNDGWPDLVLTNGNVPSSTLYILLNDQQGGFNQVAAGFGGETVQAVLADLNGDGDLDLVIVYIQGGGAEVYLGDGQGGFTIQAEIRDPIGLPGSAVVADVNGDGVPDVAFLDGDTLAIFLGAGGATYDPPFYIGTGPVPAHVLTENLHGQRASKGLPDIVAPDYSGGVMVLINLTK